MIEEDKNLQNQPTPLQVDQLRNLYHDLNNSLSNTDWAFYMLSEQKLPKVERLQYEDMLSRNLTTLQSILGQLIPLLESRREAHLTGLIALISQLKTERPSDIQYQLLSLINQLKCLNNKPV